MKRIALGLLLALVIAVPVSAGTPTAKQAFKAKVRIVANAYAKKRHWHVTDTTAAVSVTTFPGEAPSGFGSAVVGMQGGGTIAAATWSGDLKKLHGKWVVSNLKIGAVSKVN